MQRDGDDKEPQTPTGTHWSSEAPYKADTTANAEGLRAPYTGGQSPSSRLKRGLSSLSHGHLSTLYNWITDI